MVAIKIQFNFFDIDLVMRSVERKTAQSLSKAGAYVMRRAKSSIRKRKRSSRPGEPPSSHTGRLRDHIYFGLDADKASVAIGPLQFEGSNANRVLEFGGKLTIWRKSREARPYMGPALEAERPNLPALWAGSIKAA